MPEPHPKLCFRPRPDSGLHRPTMQHPVLGILEYINRFGGWWQGKTTVAGWFVRLDVQQGANIPEGALSVAADFLQWVQKNEPIVRACVEKQLSAGDARSNILDHVAGVPRLDNPGILHHLRPYMIVLFEDHAELRYDCDALPGGNLFGAQQVYVSIDSSKSPESVFLMDLGFDRRAERLFDRPLPQDALDFENSLGDQIIARAATDRLALDAELRGILKQAIEDADRRIKAGSPECASYMISVKAMLLDIGKAAPTVVKRVFADLRCHHQSGKFNPFKQKMVFSADEKSAFDRSGSVASVRLLFLSSHHFEKSEKPVDAFEVALQDELKAAAKWLAKQSPAAFQELREAGYVMNIDINILARVGQDPLNLELPPELLFECGRHGLKVSITTNNVEPD